MPRQEVPIVGGFGKDVDLHLSAQDTLNWLPVRSESPGSRSQFMLRQPPGLRPLTQIGTGPIRGVHTVEGRLYAVSGTQLYEVTSSYVGIPRGTIPGVGRVSMAHNQRGTGNELAVDNGAARYVLNTGTLAFQKVTDPGFPGSFIAFYVDQYLGYVEPQGRYWGHSDLADALEYSTLDQYEAEGDPDRIVSAYVSHREVLIFGKETTEPFVNTGSSTGTFERASNTVIENGCAARYGVAGMDNSVFWPDDKRILRRLDGYSAIRISTASEEAMLAECTDSEIKRAYAFTWEDRGHKVYYLTVPGKFTLGYDLLSGQFHRRSSPGLNTWRINSLTFWNGQWVGGDMQDGSLYALDWDYFYDGQEELVRERVTGALSKDQARMLVSEVELLFGTGGPASEIGDFSTQPNGPSITGDAPNGSVGMAYSYAYTPTGGTAPLSVALAPSSGALPAGLALSTAGVLSGTPTTVESASFTVRVTDANGLYDDLADTVAIVSGAWLYGPVNQNGTLGGGTGYYLRAPTPSALAAATPIAIPSPMASIGRISSVNGKLFLHHGDNSQNAQVSSDSGQTWTACNNSLYSASFGVLDVYWNGAFYYWADKRSADGITWGAIPNFPAITVDAWFARESDGLYFVAATNGNIYTTLDDGATAFTTRTSPFGGSSFAAFESNGTRIWGAAAGGIGVGYSDDAFATAATSSATGPGSYKKYAATVWVGQRVAGFMKRSTDGTAWADTQATVTYMSQKHFIDYGNSTFAFCDTTAANTQRIYSSANSGATWTDNGLVYGPGGNIAFVEAA